MVKTHKNHLALIMALALLFSTITSPLISYADETGPPDEVSAEVQEEADVTSESEEAVDEDISEQPENETTEEEQSQSEDSQSDEPDNGLASDALIEEIPEDDTASDETEAEPQGEGEHTVSINEVIRKYGFLSFEGYDADCCEIKANAGDTIIVNIADIAGYTFDKADAFIPYIDEEGKNNGKIFAETSDKSGVFAFVMPDDDVIVEAGYKYNTNTTASTKDGTKTTAEKLLDFIFPATAVYADDSLLGHSMTLERGDKINYSAYGFGTSYSDAFYIRSDDGTQYYAICVNPEDGDPIIGTTYSYGSGSGEWNLQAAPEMYAKVAYYVRVVNYFNISSNPEMVLVEHILGARALQGAGFTNNDWDAGLNAATKTRLNGYWTTLQGLEAPTNNGVMGYLHGVGGRQNLGTFFVYPSMDRTLGISKSSTASGTWPSGTTGSSYYSLNGAKYGVYSDAACTDLKYTLTTNASGSASATVGNSTYYVKEITAPMGYDVSSTVYTADMTSGDKTINVTDTPKKGKLKLKKTSTNPSITTGNSLYSLAGAIYGVYSDVGCTNEVTTLTTDANGDTNTVELLLGRYYVKEKSTPKGYEFNNTIYGPYTFTTDNYGTTQTVAASDRPANDPVDVILEKDDAENEINSAQGGATLAGALYQVKYYDEQFTQSQYNASPSTYTAKTPKRTWVFKTDENGKIRLHSSVLASAAYVSGDALYYDNGFVVWPLGTYSIQEIQPPEGYVINNSVYVANVTVSTDGNPTAYPSVINTTNLPTEGTRKAYEQVKRGDFSFRKVNKSGSGMEGIPFVLTNVTTGESHTLVTRTNGSYTSKNGVSVGGVTVNHSTDTNGGNATSGLWFGLTQDGTHTASVDNSRGALPYGEYKLEEQSCAENAGMQLVSIKFTIGADLNETTEYEEIDLNNIINFPEDGTSETLSSNAYGAFPPSVTTPKYIVAEEGNVITDHVVVNNIGAGYTDTSTDEFIYYNYTLTGKLIDKETGETLKDINGDEITSRTTFKMSSSTQTIKTLDQYFELGDYANALPPEDALGKKIVVYEVLTRETSDGHTITVAEHEDINDESQSVYIPGIGTTATNPDISAQMAAAGIEVTVRDTVEYKNLLGRRNYVLRGIIMDKTTGEMLLDTDGNVVSVSKVFRTERVGDSFMNPVDGTVDVDFVFTMPKELEGHDIVVFEDLYYMSTSGGVTTETFFAEHKDINDEGQTIHIPKVGTTLTDDVTNSHIGTADTTTLTDTVTYGNVIAGLEYSVTGTLYRKDTGEVLTDAAGNPITASKTFTADASSGTVEVEFTVDASLLRGVTVVAFEELRYNDIPVGIHADIDDESQSVSFPEWGIGTTATDNSTGEHRAYANKNSTITDVVAYKGLIPGK